jgi:hypothetical protein
MSPEFRPIALRANRLLGAALVECNLIKIENLEAANERLLDLMNSEQPRQITVMGILAYEMKVVKEEDILEHVVSSEGVGLVDLRSYEMNEELKKSLDLNACWATWSIPFDKEEGFTFIATAYYLSPATRSFWEKRYGNAIIWYGTTLDVIATILERFEAEPRGADK